MTDMQLILDDIIEDHRSRQDMINTRKGLQNRIYSICYRVMEGDKKGTENLLKNLLPVGQALKDAFEQQVSDEVYVASLQTETLRDIKKRVEQDEKMYEKRIAHNVQNLPIWTEWGKDTHGIAEISIGLILGSTGDLSNYDHPRKVHKRMGLAVIDGERQRRIATDKDKAIKHGYDANRRSIMWMIGDSLVRSGGPYKELYDAFKQEEINKALSESLEVLPSNQITKKKQPYCRSKGHVHNRAKRKMEKHLLNDIWGAWVSFHGVC